MSEQPMQAKEFVMSRIFDASRERVWQAFSGNDALMQWWGPKGWKMTVGTLDFRPGGFFHYRMEMDDGAEMWGKFVYREIVAPERLVFVNSFSDKGGALTRPPFSDPWPIEILNTITLTEADGKTTLMLRSSPINASDEEQKTFDINHPSMNEGYNGTWDQLEQYLAK